MEIAKIPVEKLREKYKTAFKGLVDFSREFIVSEQDWLEPSWVHYTISDMLVKSNRNVAIEAFRECGKTLLTMVSFPMYRLLKPDKEKLYVMIIKSNAMESGKYVYDMSQQFLNNPFFSWFTKEIHIQTKTEGGIFEITNKQDERVRIEGKGKGGFLRGSLWLNQRPDIILLDDINDMDDMMSPSTLSRDWEWFNSEVKFLSKTGRIFLIGNNLGHKCLIEKVFEYSEELNFETVRIPILNESGESNWPAKYSIENIQKTREDFSRMGLIDVFERELMCNSVAPESRVFDIDKIKYYDPENVIKMTENCNIYILVDYAVSTKNNSDYRVIIALAINPSGLWFVLDCDYGRWESTEFEDRLFAMVNRWKPLFVGFEVYGQQEAAIRSIEQKMVRENLFFSIERVTAGTRSNAKFTLIVSLQPLVNQGYIWFPKNAHWLPEMLSEMRSITKSGSMPKHDDLINCLAYGLAVDKIRAPNKTYKSNYDPDLIPLLGAY